MQEEKDVFKVEQSSENFDTWTAKSFVSENIRQTLRQASILIIPTLGFRDIKDPIFPTGTDEFLEFFKENLPSEFTIDICINDEDFKELALHSDYKRIGKFLVATVALNVFLNIFSSYIYDKVLKEEESKPQILLIDKSSNTTVINQTNDTKVPKKYLEPTKVTFSITVVDTNGTSKDFHYEGPAKDVEKVTEQIKQLWKDEQ